MEESNNRGKISYLNLIIAAISLVILIVAGSFVGSQIYFRSKYPLEYKEEIVKYSKEYGLDPALVASVICRESRFKLKAKSAAGARGLMQVMPETGKWIAGEIGVSFSEDMLFDADSNIRFGCWYLKYCQKRFPGKNETLAAYNAGPNKVSEWLKDKNYSSDGKTLIDIPYDETKKYVSVVNDNYEKYKKYYSKELGL